MLERADPRDVLIARPPAAIAELPEAAVIGTSSVRRKAQLLARRPDLRVVDFRGNVDTRLRKLAAGEVDATLLALAGLRRLGIEDAGMVVLTPEEMLPAVGQGAIGIECRADDAATLALLAAIDHPASSACVRAERALLAALDGSCHTPIAGHAEIVADEPAASARPDRPARTAAQCLRTERAGSPRDAERARARMPARS